MTLLATPSATTTPSRTATVLVVIDDQCCEAALAALHRAVDVSTASVSVVALPEHENAVITSFAPLSGYTTLERLAEESLERADQVARQLTATLSAGRVDYRAARGWPQVTALLASGAYDVAVVARLPRRRRMLRQLVDVSASAGAALIFAQP